MQVTPRTIVRTVSLVAFLAVSAMVAHGMASYLETLRTVAGN